MGNATEEKKSKSAAASCPNDAIVSHECGSDCKHDSDCSLHNEPAYPNKSCDCSLNTRKMVIDYLREEACRDVPEPWNAALVPVRLREVADYLANVDG